MTTLDFKLVDIGSGYRVDPLNERARAHLIRVADEAGIAVTLGAVTIQHDGWLPLAMALNREGYTVQVEDRT